MGRRELSTDGLPHHVLTHLTHLKFVTTLEDHQHLIPTLGDIISICKNPQHKYHTTTDKARVLLGLSPSSDLPHCSVTLWIAWYGLEGYGRILMACCTDFYSLGFIIVGVVFMRMMGI